jgi:putative transposase
MRYVMGHYAVSARRACDVIRATRSTAKYKSCKAPLTALRARMRELAQTRVRFGYRRLRALLQREGWEVGKSALSRVYRGRPGAATETPVAPRDGRASRTARPATARNDTWSMDFVADELSDGRRFRTLAVLDLYTRQCLDIAVGRGLTGQDVVATLERLRFDRGLPQRIYCDNGSEFVGAAMDLWAYTNKVILDFSRRGKPMDNAAIESFNGRFRDECLNVHWFEGLEDATTKIEAWRQDYVRIILTVLSRAQPQWIRSVDDGTRRRVTLRMVRKSRSPRPFNPDRRLHFSYFTSTDARSRSPVMSGEALASPTANYRYHSATPPCREHAPLWPLANE